MMGKDENPSPAETRAPYRDSAATRRMQALGGTIVLLIFGGAAFGMGLFMLQMGRDMSTMTETVVQMGRDVSSMSRDMGLMIRGIEEMATTMVEGQASMSDDLRAVRLGTERMGSDLRTMNSDVDNITTNVGSMLVNVGDMDRSTDWINRYVGTMNQTAHVMSIDVNRMTRTETLIPMMPFR